MTTPNCYLKTGTFYSEKYIMLEEKRITPFSLYSVQYKPLKMDLYNNGMYKTYINVREK